MVTLSKEAYGLSILAAFVIGVAFCYMLYLIKGQLAMSRAYKQELERNRIENLRAEIHADIMKALNGEPGEMRGVHDWDQMNEVWYSDDAPDDPLCAKNGELCERAAGHTGSCTPAA